MTLANDRDPAAVPSPEKRQVPERLRKRPEFLRVAKGRRYFTPAFALQAAMRAPDDTSAAAARFGLTVTKKTGNSVQRNRMRRRLREAIKQASGMDARPGCDYVIVAQRETLSRPFAALIGDIEKAVAEINEKLDRPEPPRRPRPGQDRKQQRKPQASEKVGTGSDQ